MGLTEFIVREATLVIGATGYPGIAFLMVLESMIMPVPSEAVMPFAGFLWYEGTLSFWGIAVASTLGSIVGSLISYALGAYGGRPLVRKFGRWLLLDEHHLDVTHRFFEKHGEVTVFVSRFIPVVRHLISIPAGVGRMNLLRFSIYTIVGAGIWNSFLTWLGYRLRDNWETIGRHTGIIDRVLVLLILGAIGFFVYTQVKRRRLEAGR